MPFGASDFCGLRHGLAQHVLVRNLQNDERFSSDSMHATPPYHLFEILAGDEMGRTSSDVLVALVVEAIEVADRLLHGPGEIFLQFNLLPNFVVELVCFLLREAALRGAWQAALRGACDR